MPQDSEEFNLIRKTKNPTVPNATSYIWILSSRHTVTKKHNNCPVSSVAYQVKSDHPEAMACDVEDDYMRIKTALEIAQELTAKRAKKIEAELTKEDYKTHGPYIIYNGTPMQNVELTDAVNSEKALLALSLPDYPSSKFVIFEMPADQMHTGGQFSSLAALKTEDPRLLDLAKKNVDITIVTSAYHLPRARRYFNSKKFANPLRDAHVTFIVNDRTFQRPCAVRDREGEIERINVYAQRGDIGEPVFGDWYDIASLKGWTPLRTIKTEKYNKLKQGRDRTIEALDLPKLKPFGGK